MTTEKKKKTPEERVTDPASVEMLKKAEAEGVDTCFSRLDLQPAPCAFGASGVCCRICHMGPCRITKKADKGVCGAGADTIVARNFLREVAAGTAAHSDHARHLVLLLRDAARGTAPDYRIKDQAALARAAKAYRIETDGRTPEDIALELAELMLAEFTAQEETLHTLSLAPANRQGLWKRHDLAPKGIDRMVVEAMHRTHMGVDHDYGHILDHAFRTALADGWGGSRMATMVTDILFGTPMPVKSAANLGVLGEKTVNVIVHGHEPALTEMLAVAVRDPEMVEYAKKAGAAGFTLAGICCTGNEILLRHGVPLAGNFLQQELAVITGAVEMLVIDVQCCMPSLPDVAGAYHTEVVATSEIAKTMGARHEPFHHEKAMAQAKALLRRAADNFKNRDPGKVSIPEAQSPIVAGFSVPAIKYMLGGTYRASFRPLNDAVIQGRIRGVCGIVGCSNPKSRLEEYTETLTRALLAENVLVLKTGCAAIASGKHGILTPEAALAAAGPGLREVCEAVGMPPVLHMGSCVDNSRILEAAAEMAAEGGLGADLSDLPAVGVAPEWMSEKAVAIGCYFVASGLDVILGHPFHTSGSAAVEDYLGAGARARLGGGFETISDPMDAAKRILELIDAKREKLGINQKAERKLFDMKDRRAAHV